MEGMNFDGARLMWDVLQTLITALVAIYVWWTSRSRATTKAINNVDTRVDQLDRDVRRLEQTLQNQPDYDDIERLRADLAENNRTLAKVSAELVGTTALLNRLHEYLLQERGGK
jgi:type VI protein secretion system component VasK